MKNRVIVFFHPAPMKADPKSGSEYRTKYISEGFEQEGYTVYFVTGYLRFWRSLCLGISILFGKKIEFLYFETSTTPLFFTGWRHLPLPFLADMLLFVACRLRGIPMGVFYRDAFWGYSALFKRNVSTLKRIMLHRAHLLDWFVIQRLFNVIFVPSFGLLRFLPKVGNIPVYESYPGMLVTPVPASKKTSPHLEVLYVGGVRPPIYDLSTLFAACNILESKVHLTICCREGDFDFLRDHYKIDLEAVRVIHVSGVKLQEAYEKADVLCMYREPDPYNDIAMPIKLFEAIGYKTPVIVNENTKAAEYVKNEGVGWAVEEKEDLIRLLQRLSANHSELEKVSSVISNDDYQNANTWSSRAKSISDILVLHKR